MMPRFLYFIRWFGFGGLIASLVITPLVYLATQPHLIDWWNIGIGAFSAALFALSFVWEGK